MKPVAVAIMLFFGQLLLFSPAAAEERVMLKLDRVQATLADSVRMKVHVSGTRNTDAVPVIQGLESFHVSRGGTSSRVQIINGKVSSGVDYTFFLQPQKSGTFEIGPAQVKLNGQLRKSNTATIVVKEASETTRHERGPAFLEASISSSSVYVEEQTLYKLKLYHRVSVSDLSLALPEIEYITFRQLGEPRNYQTTYGGKPYNVLEVQYALLASKSGDYVIGASKMNMTVRQPGARSLFDDFFKDPFFKDPFSSFSPRRPLSLTTRSLELKVHDLPQEGKPVDFSGLVGDFQMASQLEPASLRVGDSATLTIRISGRGDANRIPDIDLPELPFARTYSDQPVLESKQDGKGIGGEKTMKWALVPQKVGRFEIPPLSLSVFNPKTGSYNVLKTPRHTLSVLAGETQEVATFQAPSTGTTAAQASTRKKEIEQIGQDILPIHTAAEDLTVPFRVFTTGWRLWLALFGPLSVYLILLGGTKLSTRSTYRTAQFRSKNSLKSFRKRLEQAPIDRVDLLNAFRDYLNNRLLLSIGTLTADDAVRILRKHGVEEDLLGRIHRMLLDLENSVYAGVELDVSNRVDDFFEIVKAVDRGVR